MRLEAQRKRGSAVSSYTMIIRDPLMKNGKRFHKEKYYMMKLMRVS